MTKEPSDNSVDQTAMLLSTDWFLPHWSLIGIQVAQPSKECFQRGCRDIVLQFINGAEEYYLINFSEARTEQTRGRMRALVESCHFEESARSSVEDLITSKPHRQKLYTISWLFMGVIKSLIEDDQLDSQIKEVLRPAALEYDVQYGMDFKRLALHSPSEWDAYIRNLTPELPTTLSDSLTVSLLASRHLTGILEKLPSTQRSILLSRFRYLAKSTTGIDVVESWPAF